ncbi:hypothetical protein ACMHYB_45490 [Sorangium sp. So ce1128]
MRHWAVGILLFELVIGRHPLAPLGPGALGMVRALHVPMPSARTADPSLGALADIIDLCLRKHKLDRIPTARELSSRLEQLGTRDSATIDRPDAAITSADRESAEPGSRRTSVVAGDLEFASVSLARGGPWKVVPDRPDTSPFQRRCCLYLQLDGAAAEADLAFDVTVLNLAREHLPKKLIVRLATRTQLGSYHSSPIEACMSC